MKNKDLNKKKRVPELRFPEFSGEWEEKRLGDLGEFKNGLNKSSSDFGYGKPMVNIMDVFNNPSIDNSVEFGLVNAHKKDLVNYNLLLKDILFVRSSVKPTGVGLTSVILENLPETTYGGFLIRMRLDCPRLFNSNFLSNILRSNNIRKQIMSKATVSANTNINQPSLEQVKIVYPTLSEQEKIGNFFYTLDKKLELQEEKIDTLKEYKKGMMQKIFSQEIRFKDEDGKDYPDWEEKRLGEILEEYDARVADNDYRILSSTTEGIYYQDEYFKTRVASKNISNYKILKKGQIVLSPQNIWMGNINFNDRYDIGAVSPSYKIYNISAQCNQVYIGYIIKLPKLIHEYMVSSEQGASVVRRNLNINLFERIKIDLPSLYEQNKIANFLSSLDKKIELEEEKLENMKKIKKGLMQRMFV